MFKRRYGLSQISFAYKEASSKSKKSFHLLFLWPHLSGSKNIACQSIRLTAGFPPASGPGNQNKGSHVKVCPRCTLCCTNGPEPWWPGLFHTFGIWLHHLSSNQGLSDQIWKLKTCNLCTADYQCPPSGTSEGLFCHCVELFASSHPNMSCV